MKPDFALNLSDESIELLHRATAGWVSVDTVRFDTPDLDGALAGLRGKAHALANGEVRSKLIIPESQLRYANIHAPGPTDEARRHQIEAQIDGLTPYALDELALDYVFEGDQALVVLCARETLDEAQEFARTHGFGPVAFVAIPPRGAFVGEPFFGAVAGAQVTRDPAPVVIVPAPPAPKAAPSAGGAPTPAEGSAPAPTAKAAKPDTMGSEPPPRPIPPTPPSGEAASSPPPAAAPPPAPVAPPPESDAASATLVGDLVRRMGTRLRREQAKAASEEPRTAPRPPSAAPVPATEGNTKFSPAAQDKAPPSEARPAGSEASPHASGTEGKTGAPPVAFASRRKPDAPAAPPRGAPERPAAPGPVLAASGPGPSAQGGAPGGRLAVLPRDTGKAAATGLVGKMFGRSQGAESAPGTPAAAPSALPVAPAKAEQDLPRPETAGKPTEAEALTIFGARNRPTTETSFARRGLMLTGGLVLLLAAVGLWAAYFTTTTPPETSLPTEQRAATDSGVAETTSITPPPPVPAAEPEPEAESVPTTLPAAPADAPAPEEEAPLIEDEAAAETIQTPEALLEEAVRDATDEGLPSALLERSEDFSSATPEQGPAEALADRAETPEIAAESEMEAVEQRLAMPQPLELPQMAETAPLSPPPPPPFGTEFTLGDDGLVEATPEGALTPSGVTVYADRPAAVPPQRPAALAPAPPAAEEAESPTAVPEEPEALAPVDPSPDAETAQQVEVPDVQATTDTDVAALSDAVTEALEAAVASAPEPELADETPLADPALAGFRPRPRSPQIAPATTEPEAAAEAAPQDTADADAATDAASDEDESDQTIMPGGVSLAGLRPQQRPTDLVVTEEDEPASETSVDNAGGTPQAVATSLVPSARPDDLGQRIQEALAAARQQPQQPAAAAAPQPAASAGPQIPTTASVAERATQARAINLRRINLVGVFGTPSDRRALVRLANGRVIRVQVGDTLDGGRVSAIGDTELRYVKNGRNEVLRVGQSG